MFKIITFPIALCIRLLELMWVFVLVPGCVGGSSTFDRSWTPEGPTRAIIDGDGGVGGGSLVDDGADLPRKFGNVRLSSKFACSNQPRPTNARMINVGTFNIGHGQDEGKAAKVAQYFQEHDLDVIGLQELYTYGDNYKRDVVEDIKVEFAKRFPNKQFYFYSRFQTTGHSIMTVSVFPMSEMSYVDIAGGRSISHALLDTDFGRLRFYVTHLQRKEDAQCEGLKNAIAYIKQTNTTNDPYLVVGDYNLEMVEIFPPPVNQRSSNPSKLYCDSEAAILWPQTCKGTPCYMGGIDFIFSPIAKGPAVEEICALPLYLYDSHEFYISTVEYF